MQSDKPLCIQKICVPQTWLSCKLVALDDLWSIEAEVFEYLVIGQARDSSETYCEEESRRVSICCSEFKLTH